MRQGAIAGRVLRPDGQPAEDATVMIREGAGPHPDIAALTGPDGRFQFDDLTPGEYSVLARLDTGESATVRFQVAEGTTARQDIRL